MGCRSGPDFQADLLSLLPELKARGKTVIVISHDDGYFDLADRLIKLADGKLEYDYEQLDN